MRTPAISVIVPSAGTGRRLAGTVPKQYLRLQGRTVLEWSLAPFLARSDIGCITIVTAAGDERWRRLEFARDPRVRTATGDVERAGSVFRGLQALGGVGAEDWVLVHDAARPCLAAADLELLINTLRHDPVGGLLATPLADTLKRGSEDCHSLETVPRDALWRALTPQMFRYGLLLDCLRDALAAGRAVTDEASAVELAGHRPRLVCGRADNIKITLPEDLAIAAAILGVRETS